MYGHRLDGGHAECLARPHIEPGPVARAHDLAACELALGKRTAVVGAHVVDGVKLAVDVEERDRPAVNLGEFLSAWWQARDDW